MTMTDEQLCELLGFESIEAMCQSAAGKRGVLFIDTCDGQWIKYETDTRWLFSLNSPE